MVKNTKRTNKKKYHRKTRKIVGGLPDDLPPGTYTETTTLFTDKDTGNLTNILKHDIKSKESIDGFYEKYQILPLTILPDDGFFNYDFEKISKNAYDNTQSFFNYESDESKDNSETYDLAINTNDDVSDFIKVIQKFRTCLTDNSGGFLAILESIQPIQKDAIDDVKPASEIKVQVELLKTYFETIISTIQKQQIDMKYDENSMKINTDSPNEWSSREIRILKKPEYLENSCYVVGQVFGIISPDRKTHIFEATEKSEEEVKAKKEAEVLVILKNSATYANIITLFTNQTIINTFPLSATS